MATIPGTKRPPWLTKNDRPSHMRKHPNQDFYNGQQWRKARKQYIDSNVLCEINKARGKYVAAEVVDHIIPINKGGAPYNEKNFMPMTKKVHDIKSAFESHHGILVPCIETSEGLIPKRRNDIIYYLKKGKQ